MVETACRLSFIAERVMPAPEQGERPNMQEWSDRPNHQKRGAFRIATAREPSRAPSGCDGRSCPRSQEGRTNLYVWPITATSE